MLPLSNDYTTCIDEDIGGDGLFTQDYVKQEKKTMHSLFGEMLRKIGVTQTCHLRECYMIKSQITKSFSTDWSETKGFLFDTISLPFLSFAADQKSEMEELKSEKIEDLRKIIVLQNQLIEKRTAELEAVHQTVKSELQSCSSVRATKYSCCSEES